MQSKSTFPARIAPFSVFLLFYRENESGSGTEKGAKFQTKKSQWDRASGGSELLLKCTFTRTRKKTNCAHLNLNHLLVYSSSNDVCSQKAPSCVDVVWDRVTTAR